MRPDVGGEHVIDTGQLVVGRWRPICRIDQCQSAATSPDDDSIVSCHDAGTGIAESAAFLFQVAGCKVQTSHTLPDNIDVSVMNDRTAHL